MAFYPSEWVDLVRERSDITQIVGEYVALKRNGSRYWGLCPFHGEKTPSFSVNDEKQMYYCFGCHTGGNVFHFIMEMERLEFPEAVRYLAERARMDIPESAEGTKGPAKGELARLREALIMAARFYNTRLYSSEGNAALEYLRGRGLGDKTIRHFGLGAATGGWDDLKKHLTESGFTLKELSDAALVTVRGSGSFDTFRERAMFPIFDKRGGLVAFGGRVYGNGSPKYLNSSDTPLFHKRLNLYGLNFIKGKQQRIYLVEGYMDVVSLYQHGVRACVATLGTAITADQVRLMKRSAEETVLVYDGDDAGRRATLRALDIFDAEGARVKVATIPGGKDPDEYIRAHGREAFEQLELTEPTQYRLEYEKDGLDMSTQEGRTQYAIRAATVLKGLDNPVEIDNYVKKLAQDTGFSTQVLYEQIGKSPKRRVRVDVSANTRTITRDTIGKQEPDYIKAQQRLISLLAACDKLPIGTEDITPEDFTDPVCHMLATAILPVLGDKHAASRALDAVEDETLRQKMSEVLQLEENCPLESLPSVVQDYRRRMVYSKLEAELEQLKQSLPGQHAKPSPEIIDAMMKLSMEMNKYRP